jgi:hypothetical protein
MADENITATSSPTLAAAPSAEPEPYRPVSLLAIAGLALAVLYIALVVVVAGLGFFQATPMFLPGWTLLLAMAAAGVSLLGLWQIRESEGTRAGQSLARWGLALSIFAGLGYAAYQYFTGLALIQQANDFLMVKSDDDSGFFPRLQSGDPTEINHAFLLTYPESARVGMNPKDLRAIEMRFERKGAKAPNSPLSQFRDNFLVRSIAQHGPKAKIEPFGVEKWSYEQGGYLVSRNYRIMLPEMTVDLLTPVHSTEGDERKWFLDFRRMEFKRSELTALGKELLEASRSARAFVDGPAGQTPWKSFKDATVWESAVSDHPWKPLRDSIADCFRPGPQTHNLSSVSPKGPEIDIPSWQVTNQHLRFTIAFKYNFKGPADLHWMGKGIMVLEDKEPITLDANGLPDPQSLARQHDWRIVSIAFQNLGSMEAMMREKMMQHR